MIAACRSSICATRAQAGPSARQPSRRSPSRLPVAVPFTSFAPSEPLGLPAVQPEVRGERLICLLTDLLEAQVCLGRREGLSRRRGFPAAAQGAGARGANPKP